MGYLLRILTWILVIGVVYNLLNKYIFPIFRLSSSISSNMRKMQDQMQDMEKKMNKPPVAKKIKKDGDYIDYEEIG